MNRSMRGHAMWQDLWCDEGGMILSAELIIIVTVVVLGLITGLACLQQAVVAELQDVGGALRGMNQSYATPQFWGCRKWWGTTSWSGGSRYTDTSYGLIAGGASAEIGAGRGVIYNAPSAPARTVAPQECVDCPTVIEERCETCVPDAIPNGPIPEAVVPGCLECTPNSGTGVIQPQPEILQGPAPQILPQT